MYTFNEMKIVASPKHYAQMSEERGVSVDLDKVLAHVGDSMYQRGPFFVYVAKARLLLVLDTHWTKHQTYVVKTIYPVSGLGKVMVKREARPEMPLVMMSRA